MDAREGLAIAGECPAYANQGGFRRALRWDWPRRLLRRRRVCRETEERILSIYWALAAAIDRRELPTTGLNI